MKKLLIFVATLALATGVAAMSIPPPNLPVPDFEPLKCSDFQDEKPADCQE